MVLLIVVAVFTARTVLDNRRHNGAVSDTLETLQTIAALDAALTEANSTQRGLLLTASPAFVERYADARQKLVERQAMLRQELAGRPDQAPQLERLDRQLAARVTELDTVDRLVREGMTDEAIGRVLLARAQTDAFRDTLGEIADVERGRLAEGERRVARSGEWLLVLSVGGLGAAALMVGLSIASLRRRNAALVEANAEILALNEGLEARVRERTAALEAANEEVQRFAYVVSHDLRSPLVNVMGFTAELEAASGQARDLLARAEADAPGLVRSEDARAIREEIPEALGFIRAATARMDRLIKAILAISREGRRELAPEAVELSTLIQGLAMSLKSQLDAAGARLELGALPTLVSDRLALEQLFGNLLDNALKYARPEVAPEIRVWAEEVAGAVRVHVADNGRGIAAGDRERVFELFRRAGRQDRPGEGIGLAHVRALARRLGGSVTLASTPGEGSCFTVTLPRRIAGDMDRAGEAA